MKEGINISKTEGHLNPDVKGAKPIMACIGVPEDFGQKEREKMFPLNDIYNQDIFNVDFENGNVGFFISPIEKDFSNKFSRGYFDCTGLVVVGVDKETGQNISFLTHQDPKEFLTPQNKINSAKVLEKRLLQIKNKCVPGSIDAVVVGGQYTKDSMTIHYLSRMGINGTNIARNYFDSLNLLTEETKKILGFEPILINGPKTHFSMSDQDSILFDNENRRLYFLRRKINQKTNSFPAGEVEAHEKEWQ